MGDIKRYTIKNISEYLDIIRELRYEKYIYRGQNQAYNGIEASGFRPYKGSWTTDKFYDLEEIKEEYYNRVISRLTQDEKEYFLAFCQHHGLPTNLVDFTFTPLVALFFACYEKESPKFNVQDLVNISTEDDINELIRDKSLQDMLIHNLHNRLSKRCFNSKAEVYLIERSRLVDITDIIKNKKGNFFEWLITNNEVQCQVRDKLIEVFSKNKDRAYDWIVNLIECYEYNKMDIYEFSTDYCYEEDKILYSFKKKLRENSRDGLIELYYYAFNEINDEEITHGEMYNISDYAIEYMSDSEIEARIYLALLINLLSIAVSYEESITLNMDIYFMYQPPDLFERIISQKGMFIYQPYLYYRENVYNFGTLNYQHISPDVIIEIEYHSLILKELDYLGVGVDKIYGDFDSMARSIRYRNELKMMGK